MPEFNLVTDKWIPCLMSDTHEYKEISLCECLLEAGRVQEIIHRSPLVTVALHRFLLAVIHAGFRTDETGQLQRGPRNFDEWKSRWAAKQFNAPTIKAYLDKWNEKKRFNLFDKDRPFYQVKEMLKEVKKEKKPEAQSTELNAAEDKKSSRKKKPESNEPGQVEIHPIALLAHEAATGNNPTLFDHNFKDSANEFSAAEAARYLIARQAFSVSFGVSHKAVINNKEETISYEDAPVARGFTVMMQGANLFETLMLNLLSYSEEYPIKGEKDDAPSWEQDVPATYKKGGVIPKGYLDYLTWQSRSIHLFPHPEKKATSKCQVRQHLALNNAVLRFDPFKGYEFEKKDNPEDGYKSISPLKLNPNRALWRDSHALFQKLKDQKKGIRRPRVFDFIEEVYAAHEQEGLDVRNAYSFVVYGFATDPQKAASLIHWTCEKLPLPLSYLSNPELVESLRGAINLADKIYENLKDSVKVLAKGLATDDEARKKIASSFGADELYWSRLDTPFRKLLINLPNNNHKDEREWASGLEKTAKDALNKIKDGLDGSAKCFRTATIAQEKFDDLMRTTRRKNQCYFPPSQNTGGN